MTHLLRPARSGGKRPSLIPRQGRDERRVRVTQINGRVRLVAMVNALTRMCSSNDDPSLETPTPPRVAVTALTAFDVTDFAARWTAARKAACRAVTGEEDEGADALARVSDEDRDRLARAVFDNGRRLGASAVRHFGAAWDLDDFRELLPSLGAPCFRAAIEPRDGSCVVERAGCTELREGVGFVCDYWREALDGLVMGAGFDVYVARHASRGNGAPHCLDVLYVERPTRARGHDASGAALAPAPEGLVAMLTAAARRTLSARIAIDVRGVADGVVHYRLQGSDEDCHGAAASRLREAIDAKLAALDPPMRGLEVSPRAVFVGAP